MSPRRQRVLVLGGYRQTLSVLRSLSGTYDLFLGIDAGSNRVANSRHVRETWIHPELSSAGAGTFLSALDSYVRQQSIDIVFPVGDLEILFFAEHSDSIPESLRVVMPSEKVIQSSQQKTEMFELVGSLGVPAATFVSVADNERTLKDAIDAIGFPCIIKPENETSRVFGKKALIAASQETIDAQRTVYDGKCAAIPDDFIVQEYCLGQRRNIYFFAEHGRVMASVEVEIDRTDRQDGTGYAVEGHSVTPDPQWQQHLARVVEAMGYHGAGCLQYLIDPESGDATFLEINARLGANFACAIECGLDLPLWWVRQTMGEEFASFHSEPFSYPVGQRYTWLYGDLLGLKQAWSGGQLSPGQRNRWIAALLLANLRCQTHVTFSLTDPVPTLYSFWDLVGGPLRRVAERIASRPERESSAAQGVPSGRREYAKF